MLRILLSIQKNLFLRFSAELFWMDDPKVIFPGQKSDWKNQKKNFFFIFKNFFFTFKKDGVYTNISK